MEQLSSLRDNSKMNTDTEELVSDVIERCVLSDLTPSDMMLLYMNVTDWVNRNNAREACWDALARYARCSRRMFLGKTHLKKIRLAFGYMSIRDPLKWENFVFLAETRSDHHKAWTLAMLKGTRMLPSEINRRIIAKAGAHISKE
jgi:hypothetical protein